MIKSLLVVYLLLMGPYFCNSLFCIAQLSLGCYVERTVYSSSLIDYLFLVIPVLFVLGLCTSALKKIYIKGSIVSGIMTGLIMFLYAKVDSVLSVLYFICMGVFSFVVTICIACKIRTEADEEKWLLAGIMKGIDYKKKYKWALLLLGVCLVCVIYIISPKKWVCLYVDSNDYMNHSFEMTNDVLTIGEEVVITDSILSAYISYDSGWKFYANRSGETTVSILSDVVYEDNDDWVKETWDIYVEDNLYVHYDADYEYYLNVYEFFFFVIVNFMTLSVMFFLSGYIDMRKPREANQTTIIMVKN